MKKQIKQREREREQNTSPKQNATPVSDKAKQKIVKQYRDRAEKESSKQNPVDWGYFNSPKFGSPVDERKQIANSAEASPSRKYGADRQTIAEGSIDPNRDTVYRVGADDPYGYYSQAQLNNNMSGNDANAIYQATHEQRNPWGYGNYYGFTGFNGQTPQEHNDRLREEGYKPRTGAQAGGSYGGNDAYVAGAGAQWSPLYDELMQAGVGSPVGIPREYLSSYGKHLNDLDWLAEHNADRQDWFRDYMNNGRRNEILSDAFGAVDLPDGGLDEYDLINPAGVPHNIYHINLPYSEYMTPQQQAYQELLDVIDDLSNTESRTANPNIKGNPLYGYGNPALSYDGLEYQDPAYLTDDSVEWDSSRIPEDQDMLDYHFWQNGSLGDTEVLFRDAATQEQKDDLARAFTLLRNMNDYQRQQNLDAFVAEQRQRDLYGDTLVDLLQNSPKGQSILEPILQRRLPSRKRNITGEGDWWSVNPNYVPR